jgi:hypothetical protein
MNQPLIIEKSDLKSLSDELREMAERIDRNADGSFGGAFVLLPPGGEPVKTLLIDSGKDPAQFWGTLKTKCEMALAGLEELQRNQNPYMR